MQSRQMDENKNTFRAFHMFVQDEDHPQFNEAQALTWTYNAAPTIFSSPALGLAGSVNFVGNSDQRLWSGTMDCTARGRPQKGTVHE